MSLSKLKLSEITENVIFFRIDSLYEKNMSSEKMYEATRGCWRHNLDYVLPAEYAIAFFNYEIKEVYKIISWNKAENDKRKYYPFNPATETGKLVFKGEIASDLIRNKYVGKNIQHIYDIKGDYRNSAKKFYPVSPLDDSTPVEKVEKHASEIGLEYLLRIAELHETNTPKLVSTSIVQTYRSPYISAYAKIRANGICQLCNNPAPFSSKDGKPYLESHHIIWLSKGGSDSLNNTVALCPNCHKKMHIVNDNKDIKYLKSVVH